MITIDDVGQALMAALNASPFSAQISGTWDYLPTYRFEDLGSQKVPVVPAGLAMEEYTRGADQNDFTLEVAVQKRTDGTPEMLRGQSRLLHEIARFCLRADLLDGQLRCVRVEIPTIYDARHLQEMRVYTGVIRATFRAIEEA